MAEPDFSDEHPYYTTLPVYESLKDYILTEAPTLYAGVHQADSHWALEYTPDTITIADESAEFGDAIRTNGISFYAHPYNGDGELWVRWRGDSITICADNDCIRENASSDDWQTVIIALKTDNERASIQIRNTDAIVIDSITVIDRQFASQWGIIVVAIVGVLMSIIVILDIMRGRARG
jgi:hypothetical protein